MTTVPHPKTSRFKSMRGPCWRGCKTLPGSHRLLQENQQGPFNEPASVQAQRKATGFLTGQALGAPRKLGKKKKLLCPRHLWHSTSCFSPDCPFSKETPFPHTWSKSLTKPVRSLVLFCLSLIMLILIARPTTYLNLHAKISLE